MSKKNLPDSEKWDKCYQGSKEPGQEIPQPCQVLAENKHLLPSTGTALEIACGLGGNALFLASRNLHTSAWDISEVAIERLNELAKKTHITLDTLACDVSQKSLPTASFDVIVISHFLDRTMAPRIYNAIKPGGLLFYQTFIRNKAQEIGPSNPDFLLKENEMLQLFPDMTVLVYREEGLVGNLSEGFRNRAMFVGKK